MSLKLFSVSFVVNKNTLERMSTVYAVKGHAVNKCRELRKQNPSKNLVVWTWNLSWPDNEETP